MSDKPTPPPAPQSKQPDPMAAVIAGIRLTRDRRAAQVEVERLRSDLTAANERAEVFSTEAGRKSVREHDRRALLAGRVFLQVLHDDPDVWTNFWPHLSESLGSASDTDRALFDLPPRSKKPEAKQDAEGEKSEGKSEGEPAAKQGAEGEKQDGPTVPADDKPLVPPIPAGQKLENSVA